MQETTGAAAAETLAFRRTRELSETAARGVLGGAFYVVGWLAVVWFGGVYAQHPLLSLLLLAAFIVLTLGRIVLRRRAAADAAAEIRLLRIWWLLLGATALLWGLVATWTLLDAHLAPARMAAILCTVAFATAFAHTYAMRARAALVCIALLVLPIAVLTWRHPGMSAVAFSLAIYLIYLVSALRASRAQFERQVALELALRRQRDLYERQSRTDALTGLDNRREFTFELEQALQDVAPLSLLLIDIDHFKRVNDSCGHACGDAVLVALAELLRIHFDRPGASLARIGGEEFAVVLRGVDEGLAEIIAAALCRRVAGSPLLPPGAPGPVTLSVGVGQWRRARYADADAFVAAVDRALYRAKDQGRDQVCRSD